MKYIRNENHTAEGNRNTKINKYQDGYFSKKKETNGGNV